MTIDGVIRREEAHSDEFKYGGWFFPVADWPKYSRLLAERHDRGRSASPRLHATPAAAAAGLSRCSTGRSGVN